MTLVQAGFYRHWGYLWRKFNTNDVWRLVYVIPITCMQLSWVEFS